MKQAAQALMKRRHFILGTLISIVLIYFIVKSIELEALKQAIYKANLLWIIPFLGSAAISLWYKAEKWRLLLQPLIRPRVSEVMPSVVIGTAVNFLLFSYLGELIRVYLYTRDSKISKSAVFGTVILERVFDVIFTVTLAGIGFSFSKTLPDHFISIGYAISFFGLLSFGFVAGAVFFTDIYLKGFRALLKILPLHLQDSFIKYIEQGILGFHSLRDPKLLFFIVLAGLIQWVVIGMGVYTIFLAVGISVPFFVSFITLAAIVFGSILPSSPAQIGMIEFSFILSLGLVGVPEEKALVAAILFHFFLYFAMCLLALWYLKKMGIGCESVLAKVKQFDQTE